MVLHHPIVWENWINRKNTVILNRGMGIPFKSRSSSSIQSPFSQFSALTIILTWLWQLWPLSAPLLYSTHRHKSLTRRLPSMVRHAWCQWRGQAGKHTPEGDQTRVSATEPQNICRNLRRGGLTTIQRRTDEPASRPPSSTATCQVRVPLKTSTTGSKSGNL